MKSIIQQHKYFFGTYIILLLIGLTIRLQIEKGDIIFFFSENRQPFLDNFFGFATTLGEAIVYTLLIIGFLFVRYRYSILIFSAAAFAGVSGAVFKAIFRFPRPKPYFANMGIDISDIAVNGHDLYNSQVSSFPSGHTISAFTLFTVLALLCRNVYLKISLLLVAVTIGVSRIYLVHHFLEDVLLGSFIGICIGLMIMMIHNSFPVNKDIWYNRSLISKKVN